MIEDKFQYNSVVVAKYIVAYANENRYAINITKLQKLLYITYGIYLAVTNERLTNEHPQAWPFGPVFPTTRKRLLKKDLDTITMSDEDLKEISKDSNMISLMNLVFSTFGSYTASALTAWSHKPDSPWDKASKAPLFVWGDVINDELILDYFKKRIVNKKDS